MCPCEKRRGVGGGGEGRRTSSGRRRSRERTQLSPAAPLGGGRPALAKDSPAPRGPQGGAQSFWCQAPCSGRSEMAPQKRGMEVMQWGPRRPGSSPQISCKQVRGHCSEEPVHPRVSIWRSCHLWEAEGEGRGRGRGKERERGGCGEEGRVLPHPGPGLLPRTPAELALLRPRSRPQDSSFPVLGMLTGPWVREDTLLSPPPLHSGSSSRM